MKKSTFNTIKAVLILFAVIVIFYFTYSFFSYPFVDLSIFSFNIPLCILIYVLILIAESVFAPISTLPLVPLAAGVFGWWQAALITLAGWTIGAYIVLIICKKYGKPLINKFVPLEKLERYEKIVPTQHIFVNIIILRMFMPIDIVSYAIGLFTNVKTWHYVIATFIGYAPLAFFVAYLGKISPEYQIIGALICIILIIIQGALLIRKKRVMERVKKIVNKTKKRIKNNKISKIMIKKG